MQNYHHFNNFTLGKWEEIKNSYTYHLIEDESFRKELDDFYLFIDMFNELRSYSQKRVEEIVKKHGSNFYKLDVTKITLYEDSTNYPTANVSDCLLFNISPYEIFGNRNTQFIIQIGHNLENTYRNTEKKDANDLEEFDKIWQKMLDETSQDKNIEKLRMMVLKIHTKNLRLRQKLVKRVSERQKL